MNDQSAASSTEMELKFEVDPAALTKLRRLKWLNDLQCQRARGQTLKATYFDTRDWALRKAGLSLRIRKEGRHLVQCLKGRETADGGSFTRPEFECIVSTAQPDLTAFEDPLAHAMLPINGQAIIEPLFETDIRRTKRRLQPQPGTIVACDIDVGEVRAGDRTQAVCEIELELVEGDPMALFDIANRLVDEPDIPVRLSGITKAARGIALAQDGVPQWTKGQKLSLSRGITAEDALAAQVGLCMEHLRANEACTLARAHVEGIHQMRVAVRRLRSTLSIYRKLLPPEQYTELNNELRWLIQSMGDARDWDVFITETLAPMETTMADAEPLELLHSAAERQRDLGYQTALEAIRSDRYTKLLLRLGAWMTRRDWREQTINETSYQLLGPATDYARMVLGKRHKRILKEGKHFKHLAPEQRHELRIDVKKIRYASDFFASLYDEKDSALFANRLGDLQDGLGVLNDVAVTQGLLQTLRETAPEAHRDAINIGSGMVIGWQMHVANEKLAHMEEAWKRFKKTDPFW